MSDDEGEDYGDYEELGIGDEPIIDEEVGPIEEDDDEVGLEEDAAGSDEDDEPEEEEAEPVETQKAKNEKNKVDPLLRVSNKARFIKIVDPEKRVTDNRLHKSEAALIIAMRAQQIAKFATCFTNGDGLHDPVALAFKELLDRKCPLKLRRPIGTGPAGELIVEEWIVREMTLPLLTLPGR
jgi:DNA-directed RNA polymerase subunit K/omega